MQLIIPRIVIAAPSSGSGKTTIATGLMAAFARRCRVQGFKVGPDYIDPGYHTSATGRPSRNLDSWMLTPQQMTASFARAASTADLAIIEGVMGLFDGYGATESGSSAEIAKRLAAPVILVLDVGRMSRTAGAMALGLRAFDPALNVAGVICNRVGSERHADAVTQAIEQIGLSVLGCLPKLDALNIPERHLGLHTADERAGEVARFLDEAAAIVSRHVDLDRLWALASTALPLEVEAAPLSTVDAPPVRIAVARDEAFCFYYEDNFDLLRAAGAEIVPFSPLHDAALPTNISGLYLGGGYPELYAAQLAANAPMLSAIRAAAAQDLPIYAECGGLMFLTQGLTDLAGNVYPMLGLLPGQAQMQPRLTMGYREVTAMVDTPLLPAGTRVRGHEFHYSNWVDVPEMASRAYEVAGRSGENPRLDGFARNNLLASYIHLHFAADPSMAARFVASCRAWNASQS